MATYHAHHTLQPDKDGNRIWTISGDAKNMTGKDLFTIVDVCREVEAHPDILNGELRVLGKN